MSEIILPIIGGLASSSPPTIKRTTALRPYLAFDDTTDEVVQYSMRMPVDYVSGLAVKGALSMESATTNNVAIKSQVMAVSNTESINTDSFDALNVSADIIVPGTVGLVKEFSFSLTTVDSIAAGDYFAIEIGRENTTTGTNATGDMFIWYLSLSYATS